MSVHALETKSFGPLDLKSDDRGEVVAIVATLGVVDRDGDVILRGAIPPGGSRVKLSGYNHDVVLEGKAPVGKGVISEEGDRAIFRGKFFLTTERGRQAFLTTKELGADGEWSLGFPKATVKTGDLTADWQAKGARRVITSLTPIEASPVFIGAGRGTGTLSTKAADGDADAEKREALRIWERTQALVRDLETGRGDPNYGLALDVAEKSVRWLTGGRRQKPPLVRFFPFDGKRAGYFQPLQPDSIYVSTGLTEEQCIRTVAHETEHWLSPWDPDEGPPRVAGDWVLQRYQESGRVAR